MLLVIEVHGVHKFFIIIEANKGKALAFDIDQSLKQLTNSRKPISGCGFRVLRATKTLGVLIECGFLFKLIMNVGN